MKFKCLQIKQTNITKSFNVILNKKRVSTIVIIIMLSFSPALSFSQSWQWALSGGGIMSDKANAMTIDDQGNTYITGYFNDSANFGLTSLPFIFSTGLFGAHNKEVFIAKIDPNGNYLWVRRGENNADDRGLGICLDPQNNIFVTGCCWGQITFGSLTAFSPNQLSDDVFVLKLDSNGNFIWLTDAGCEIGDDLGYDLVSDKLGNIYLSGFTSNESWVNSYINGFDIPSNTQIGPDNIQLNWGDSLAFVAKLSPGGVWLWARSFPGIEASRDNRIAIDSLNNVYITGGFWGTKTFGTTTVTNIGGFDIFVVKYDSNGNFQFVKTVGSTLYDRGNDITVDPFGDVYITGEFRDKAVFGTDTINNNGGPNGKDIFVAKMKTNGDWVWAKKAGSNGGSDRGDCIIGNKKGNLFVTGQFRDSARFGGNIILSSGIDSLQIFVAAIDTTGKWKWALQGGGQDDDRGNTVVCDDSCNLYVTGYYKTNGTFGAYSLTSQGAKDAFTAKVDNACFDYIVPPINPQPEFNVSIPNVFSPNDDGVNDVFKISTKNIEALECKIYNRWGILVNEIIKLNEGWDGRTTSGLQCSVGVYYYVLSAIDINDKDYDMKGFVQLLK